MACTPNGFISLSYGPGRRCGLGSRPGHDREAPTRSSAADNRPSLPWVWSGDRRLDDRRSQIQSVRWLARPEGFEPPTLGFEDRYSIQLSYGRVCRRTPLSTELSTALEAPQPEAFLIQAARKMKLLLGRPCRFPPASAEQSLLDAIAPLLLTASASAAALTLSGRSTIGYRQSTSPNAKYIKYPACRPDLLDMFLGRLDHGPCRPPSSTPLGAFRSCNAIRTDIWAWRSSCSLSERPPSLEPPGARPRYCQPAARAQFRSLQRAATKKSLGNGSSTVAVRLGRVASAIAAS